MKYWHRFATRENFDSWHPLDLFGTRCFDPSLTMVHSNCPTNIAVQAPRPAEPAQIWKARHFIHENLDAELSLKRVAGFVNISANHLSDKFKEVTGINFVDYIARQRFENARRLLADRRWRISEIAFEVGFQSLSQFNRVFKRLSGRSPTEYRAAACEAPNPPPVSIGSAAVAASISTRMKS